MSDERESAQPTGNESAGPVGPLPIEFIPTARPLAFDPPPTEIHRDRAFLLFDERQSSVWIDVALMILFLLATEVFLGTLLGVFVSMAGSLRDLSEGELERVLLIPAISVRAVIVVGLAMVILRHRGQGHRALGLEGSRLLGHFGVGVLSVVVAYGLITLWLTLLWVTMPGLLEEMNENANRLMDLLPRMSPLGFLLFAVLVGLYEELLFRGFFMPRLRRATGSWVLAVVLSTVPFAMLHLLDQEPIALGPVAILSLVFSVVTIMRQSIVPAIVGHTLFDLSQFLWLSHQAGDSWT